VWPENRWLTPADRNELAIALQGRHLAQIANALIAGRKTVG
jgi:DNA-binding CsgD family transcriptional regulator